MGSRRSAVSGRTTSTVIELEGSDTLSSPLLPGFGIGLRELFVA